jgi:hypothetical protein
LQVIPQFMPSQVEEPLAGTGHALHELPQLPTSVFEEQPAPQA